MPIQLLILRLRKLVSIIRIASFRNALFRHRVMAGVEHRSIFLQPFATVIDIGANRGQFALVAREYGCKKIISFEPLPEAASVFRELFASDPAVSMHMVAIGECDEQKRMHLSARDDSSSLLEIGKTQSDIFSGTHEIGTTEIEVRRLEQCLRSDEIVSPALLKLDVQGYELQALKGCNPLLDRFDAIYCECSFVELYKGQHLANDVIVYLYGLGYGFAGIFNPFYDGNGQCIQADFLFRRLES